MRPGCRFPIAERAPRTGPRGSGDRLPCPHSGGCRCAIIGVPRCLRTLSLFSTSFKHVFAKQITLHGTAYKAKHAETDPCHGTPAMAHHFQPPDSSYNNAPMERSVRQLAGKQRDAAKRGGSGQLASVGGALNALKFQCAQRDSLSYLFL